MRKIFYLPAIAVCILMCSTTFGQIYSSSGQNTQVRGFSSASGFYEKDKFSFAFSELDLLITSEISDRLYFLGETVFRFDHHSEGTRFSVEVERVILKYNLKGNHNLLIGKHHTPINYWNDIYHHGKLFYPTIARPQVFISNIIPLHTTGMGIQGHDLGKYRFGYDIMVGNGLGSEDVQDNDKYKSITLAAHFKPTQNLRIGASYYYDIVSKGAAIHQHADDQDRHEDRVIDWKVKHHLFSGHVAFFGRKFEFLGEGSLAVNHTDSTCYQKTFGSYLYAGYKINRKLTLYTRADYVNFEKGEIFFIKDNTSAILAGLTYHINYLANVKLEYEYKNSEITGNNNKISAQIAVGF